MGVEIGSGFFLGVHRSFLTLFKAVIWGSFVKGASSFKRRDHVDVPEGALGIVGKTVMGSEHITYFGEVEFLTQRLQGRHIHLAVIVEDVKEAPATVFIQGDGISGEQQLIIDQIAQVPQRVTGHQEGLHLEIADLRRLPVLEQLIPVRDGHAVFQAERADLLTVPGIGEIVFLALAQINPGVLKSILLTNIQAARMSFPVGAGCSAPFPRYMRGTM